MARSSIALVSLFALIVAASALEASSPKKSPSPISPASAPHHQALSPKKSPSPASALPPHYKASPKKSPSPASAPKSATAAREASSPAASPSFSAASAPSPSSDNSGAAFIGVSIFGTVVAAVVASVLVM